MSQGPSKVTLMLAQYARMLPNSTLDVLGGGWAEIGEGPMGYFIAGFVEFPVEEIGVDHFGQFDLLDPAGNVVERVGPDGQASPVSMRGTFRQDTTGDIQPGSTISMPFAMPVDTSNLPAGGYRWRLRFEQDPSKEWSVGFTVIPQPPSPLQG